MNKITITILILLLFGEYYFVAPTENEDKLLAVAVYFRHGDRTPEKSFPTDEFFKMENFPMGLGQLTNEGINRHFELGKWLRQRYDNFLPTLYSPNDIYVRSTDVDRTLMSAAANLAGFYPPEGDQIWNSNLLWRPIPIHTTSQSDDFILAMNWNCSKWQKLYEKYRYSEFYKKINEEYADVYEYMTEHSGLNVTDIEDVRLIRSALYCYKNYNSSFIPSWALNMDQTKVDYLAGLSYGRYSFNTEMKRLRAGPFINYLIKYFEDIESSGDPKFLMFSSHDTELASILDAMGVYDVYPPGFASTIIWEVRNNSEGIKYVNLFYRRRDLFTLDIPGCESSCKLGDFKRILEPVTVDLKTWEEECPI